MKKTKPSISSTEHLKNMTCFSGYTKILAEMEDPDMLTDVICYMMAGEKQTGD